MGGYVPTEPITPHVGGTPPGGSVLGAPYTGAGSTNLNNPGAIQGDWGGTSTFWNNPQAVFSWQNQMSSYLGQPASSTQYNPYTEGSAAYDSYESIRRSNNMSPTATAQNQPTYNEYITSRPGFYTDVGDSQTDVIMQQQGVSELEALRQQIDYAATTPGLTDDRFYQNELSKATQNLVEASSGYHAWGMDTGLPVAPNPFEYVGDLALGLQKGTNGQSSAYGVAPVDLNILGLPGGQGIQDAQWNMAVAYDKNQPIPAFPDFTQAISTIDKARNTGEMGPYANLGSPTWQQWNPETQSYSTEKIPLSDQQAIGYYASGGNFELLYSDPANMKNAVALGWGMNYNTPEKTVVNVPGLTVEKGTGNIDTFGYQKPFLSSPNGTAPSASTPETNIELPTLSPTLGFGAQAASSGAYTLEYAGGQPLPGAESSPAPFDPFAAIGGFFGGLFGGGKETPQTQVTPSQGLEYKTPVGDGTYSSLTFTIKPDWKEFTSTSPPTPEKNIIDTSLDWVGGNIRAVGEVPIIGNIVDMGVAAKPVVGFVPVFGQAVKVPLELASRPGAQAQPDDMNGPRPYGEFSAWGGGAGNWLEQQGWQSQETNKVQSDIAKEAFRNPEASPIDKFVSGTKILGLMGSGAIRDNPAGILVAGEQIYLAGPAFGAAGEGTAAGSTWLATKLGASPGLTKLATTAGEYVIPAGFTVLMAGEATKSDKGMFTDFEGANVIGNIGYMSPYLFAMVAPTAFKAATELSPYRVEIGRADIKPASGGDTTASYQSIGVKKVGGPEGQIERTVYTLGGIKTTPEGSSLFRGTPSPLKSEFNFPVDKFGNTPTFVAKTPLETSMLSKLSGAESPKIELPLDIRTRTSYSGLDLGEVKPAIKEVVDSHNIPNSGVVADTLTSKLVEYDTKLYGSSVQRGVGIEQGTPSLGRLANDLDVMVPRDANGAPQYEQFANDVVTSINRDAGKPIARVTDITPDGASIKIGNGKLFDVHNVGGGAPEMLPSGVSQAVGNAEYTGLGMKVEPTIFTKEGVEVISYSEQVGRKAVGTSDFTWEPRTVTGKDGYSVTGTITPKFEGRMKDIGDYYFGERANIVSMEKSPSYTTRKSAEKASTDLESWLDMWGKEASTKIRSDYTTRLEGRDPVVIDFGGMKETTSPSMGRGTTPFYIGSSLGIPSGGKSSESEGSSSLSSPSKFMGVPSLTSPSMMVSKSMKSPSGDVSTGSPSYGSPSVGASSVSMASMGSEPSNTFDISSDVFGSPSAPSVVSKPSPSMRSSPSAPQSLSSPSKSISPQSPSVNSPSPFSDYSLPSGELPSISKPSNWIAPSIFSISKPSPPSTPSKSTPIDTPSTPKTPKAPDPPSPIIPIPKLPKKPIYPIIPEVPKEPKLEKPPSPTGILFPRFPSGTGGTNALHKPTPGKHTQVLSYVVIGRKKATPAPKRQHQIYGLAAPTLPPMTQAQAPSNSQAQIVKVAMKKGFAAPNITAKPIRPARLAQPKLTRPTADPFKVRRRR